MTGATRGGRYPAELHERAVRMVLDHQDEYPSQWSAIVTVAGRLNIHPETLRTWVRREEVDEDRPPGVTEEKARIAERERDAVRCLGTFRDHAPRVESAAASIVGGELRIEPVDRDAYPPGFVLRASSEAVIWSGDLIPPIDGVTLGQRRFAWLQQRFLPMIEPVQGKAGAWVLFGEAPVDSAFRPDDPVRFNAMVEQAKLPVRLAPDGSGPPEPNGGLLVLGLLVQLAVVMSVGGFLVGASGTLDAGWTVLASLAAIALGVAALVGLQRWWIGTLLLRVSQRRRRRSAVDGRAQPHPPPLPGLGTLVVFVVAGLAAGLVILATAIEPHRTLAFPIGGAAVGLVIGTVWVGASRLPPSGRRSTRPG